MGVDARWSATWSRIGVSGSCPIALMTGVVHAATARLPLARAIEFVPRLTEAATAIARTFA